MYIILGYVYVHNIRVCSTMYMRLLTAMRPVLALAINLLLSPLILTQRIDSLGSSEIPSQLKSSLPLFVHQTWFIKNIYDITHM